MYKAKLFSEDLSCIVESSTTPKGVVILEGIFAQAAIYNRNKRMYPESVLMPEVERYTEQFVEHKNAYGELDHPSGPQVSLQNASHIITELRIEGSNVYGKARLTDTPMGDIAKGLIKSGGQLSVSTRGLGAAKRESNGNSIIEKYHMTAVDIVSYPSAPDAYVNGIMESMEFWMTDDDRQIIEETKNSQRQLFLLNNVIKRVLSDY